jgi:hypothetical protein
MSIKPRGIKAEIDLNNIEIDPDDLSDEVEVVSESTMDSVHNIVVKEVKLPNGRSAIEFISPISGVDVIIAKPTALDIISIEDETIHKHRQAGQFKQSVITLSKLIVGYGDRRGENVMSYNQVLRLELNEILTINKVLNDFFRIGEI